jgi:protein associated with RNAse G/E
MTTTITVNKLNLRHELTWSYMGEVIERTPEHILLEARFNRDTLDLGYAVFERNDRFVERFFTDRWYNIFEVHAVNDDRLKGWYCNIVKPAVFSDCSIEQVDLALDVWINPNGSYQVLDQMEFDELPLDPGTRHQAQRAVSELIHLLYHRAAPFTSIEQPRAIGVPGTRDASA